MSNVDEVKQRIDIVEVISDYLPLQKSGQNFKAVCPFHHEKTPSFYVFPERQSWHCFGACGTGGDVFSFVMKKENIDFGEALRILAQRVGVSLERTEAAKVKTEQKKQLTDINQLAAQYYQEKLLKSLEANEARAYVTKRGLSQEVIQNFLLGYSLNSMDALLKYLVSMGCLQEDLVAVGLINEKEPGRCYDRFRNRLMFPIRDVQGLIVGFGARALDDAVPKYLNSPQSLLFDKGSIVYGLDRSKEAIKEQGLAVIVEGYMDVIAAHQYGFENVVASMGTSLTEKQVGHLKKLTKNIAFALDADAAGEAATRRGIEKTTEVLDQKVVPVITPRGAIKYENTLDAELKVIVLPPGNDPDDIIRNDPQQWQSLVADGLSVIDYFLNDIVTRYDLTNPGGKSEAVKQMQPIIGEIKDPIRRAYYIQKLARIVGIEQRLLSESLGAAGGLGPKSRRKEKTNPSDTVAYSLSRSDNSWEDYCLALLFQWNALRGYTDKLLPDYFERSENRELFLAWANNSNDNPLQEILDPNLKDHFRMLVAKEFPPMTEDKAKKALDDCVRCLRERWLKNLKIKEETLLLSINDPAEIGQQLELFEAVELNAKLGQVFQQKDRRQQLSE